MAPLTPGNIFITSDLRDITQGDAAEISAVDGSTVQTLAFPKATTGAILPSGIFCIPVEGNGFLVDSFNVYDATGTLIAAVTSPLTDVDRYWYSPIYAWGEHTFYVFAADVNTGLPRLYTISDVGVVGGQTWDITTQGNFFLSLAVSNDGTILYFNDLAGIYRYDLVNDVPLSDLIVTPNFAWAVGLFVTPDDNIVAAGIDVNNLDNVVVIDPTGTILAAYPFDDDDFEIAELFSDVSPAYIWMRTFPTDDGVTSNFRKVLLADGTVAVFFTVATLESSGDVPATCPNFLLRSGVVPPPECPGLVTMPRTDGLPYSPFTP